MNTLKKCIVHSTELILSSAIGCSYLIPPEDAWLRRNGDEMTVGCYSSHQTWILRCVGHEWIGALPGNCSALSKSNQRLLVDVVMRRR